MPLGSLRKNEEHAQYERVKNALREFKSRSCILIFWY